MLRRPIALALAASIAAQALAAAQDLPESGPRGPEILATGQGLRTVQADRATLHVAVRTSAATPNAAGERNAALNNAIRAAIAGVGVAREDISTAGYMVYSTRPQDPRQFQWSRDSGFVATNTVRVLIRRPEQLALVGRVIDTALSAGATHINGVFYEARRTAEAEREALAEAVADARARAESMARAAGGSLGELLHLSASGSPGYRPPFAPYPAAAAMMRAGGPEPTTVTSGDIEVRQSVTARWRFVPGRR
jgi:uncharacterized protein